MNTKSLTVTMLSGITLLSTALLTQADSGFYAGVAIGQSTLAHEIQRDTGSDASPSISTRNEETDIALRFSVGYTVDLTEKTHVAVEGFYSLEDASTLSKNNLLVSRVNLDSTYGFNVKPGIHITEDFTLFAILGLTVLDFELNNSYPFAPPVRSASEQEQAFNFGFGGEYTLTDNFSVFGEYSQVKDVSFDPIPEVAVAGKINPNELDYSSLNIGVKYLF